MTIEHVYESDKNITSAGDLKKRTTFFIAFVDSKEVIYQADEIADFEWVQLNKIAEKLTHRGVETLSNVKKILTLQDM